MQNPQFASVPVSQGALQQELEVILDAVHKSLLESQTETYHPQCVTTHGILETSMHPRHCFSVLPSL